MSPVRNSELSLHLKYHRCPLCPLLPALFCLQPSDGLTVALWHFLFCLWSAVLSSPRAEPLSPPCCFLSSRAPAWLELGSGGGSQCGWLSSPHPPVGVGGGEVIGAAAKENGQLTTTRHWAKPLPTLAPGMDAATATRSCPTWRRPTWACGSGNLSSPFLYLESLCNYLAFLRLCKRRILDLRVLVVLTLWNSDRILWSGT